MDQIEIDSADKVPVEEAENATCLAQSKEVCTNNCFIFYSDFKI